MLRRAALLILLVVALVMVGLVSEKAASLRYQSQIRRLEAQVEIYQAQAEDLSAILRGIRSVADQAISTEKASKDMLVPGV